MNTCKMCYGPLSTEKQKANADYCTEKCRQKAYRQRRKANRPQTWRAGDKALANGCIVTIGESTHDHVMVRILYTVARVPEDTAAVWRKVPKNKLAQL